MKVLVTGSSGLIGSEAVRFFHSKRCDVYGIDNNLRAVFFGPGGDTRAVLAALKDECNGYVHFDEDIRNRDFINTLMAEYEFDVIIHAAAQPSHDLAASRPFDDFDVNAVGTLNLLEACRTSCPESVFVFLSTNKVYGDGPNNLPLKELDMRWEFADPEMAHGVSERFPVDQCLHSLFGASKLAADILCQEYGRYFGMKTGIFRGGCLTGPHHTGVELHGFLNYLVKAAAEGIPYTIFGYKGKQVRDQLHSHDVINCLWSFIQKPRRGEVYNLGGGKDNSASLLECVEMVEEVVGKKMKRSYEERNRVGDHICYYSDLRKLQQHYPDWTPTYSLRQMIEEIADAYM